MKATFYCLIFLALSWGACKTSATKVQTDKSKTTAINLCGPTAADLTTQPGKDGTLAPLFTGVNVYHYPVTTKSKTAQKYFNQGFVLNMGFNHAEASRSFREAIRQDPECAMCYWGLAYVLGPNYNAIMSQDVLTPANDAIMNATLNMHRATSKEQALIKALSRRYPETKDIDPNPYYEAYAEAMKGVMKQFPKDVDIAVMTAEALMDLHPWQIWTPEGTPHPWTMEIVNIIEGALAKNPNHPQAMHLYMHAMEASNNPEKALEAADNLRFAVPGSGHLLHMPSHTYINTGHYHKGSLANERAVKVDSTYVEACHEAGIYPLAYYPHNWHFLAACSALEGRGERSLEASRYMADFVVDQELMRSPELATLQHFYSIPWFVMVKFAMWEDILKEKKPAEDLLYPQAIWQYAQGMAYAARKDFRNAEASLKQIEAIAKDSTIQKMTIWDINTVADVVDIAQNVLKAEIAQRQGKLDLAIQLFTKAIEIEDQLNYNEPPDWFFSVRHLLGDVLLQSGQYAKAEKLYREDLRKLKNNGWALIGLQKSLEGQGKTAEAKKVKQQFEEAWQWANIELESSVL